MIVKVCGMRDAENIREVEALGIDLMGFIFWPKSSRYVSTLPSYLPEKAKRIGVFVDEEIEVVKKIAQEYALHYIQLHGNETPDYCALLKGHKLIKAFNIATADDFVKTKPYETVVDYFLFDTKGKSVGGNGTKFDWSVLADYHGTTPFILSGGIGPDDAADIRHFRHPQLAGIDLNSRFEIDPGLKNVDTLKLFLSELNR